MGVMTYSSSSPRWRVARVLSMVASCCAAFCALARADDARPRTFLDFRPSQHGFLFVNSFDGSPIGDIGIPGASVIAKGVVGARFGLCGGMSFAAADLFRAGVARPAQATVPPPRSAWYEYIHARQAESVGRDLGVVHLFVAWMHAPDNGLTGVRVQTLAALESMRGPLEAGRGAVVGMVFPGQKRGRARALWEHHQVLAYRVESRGAGGGAGKVGASPLWRVFIYDPNYPTRDDAMIEVRPVVAAWARTGTATPFVPVIGAAVERRVPGRDRSPLRGIFGIPYTPRVPPASLFEGADARW